MYLQGYSVMEIRNSLNEAGQMTPNEYFNFTRGYNFNTVSQWSIASIYNMLKNEQYTGSYIASVKSMSTKGKRSKIPKSEWVILPDKHQPIISTEDYLKVQELRIKCRQNMEKRNYLLKGKTSCGCCGYALMYGNPTTLAKYRCIHTLGDKKAECHKMSVNANELEEAVLSIIKNQADVVLKSIDLTNLQKKTEVDRIVAEYEEQIRKWIEQRQINYERFALNEIDRETHKELMKGCTEQLTRLNSQLAIIKQAKIEKEEARKLAALAQEALKKAASPQDIVNALIDKVYVFPGNRLEIKWKFVYFENINIGGLINEYGYVK